MADRIGVINKGEIILVEDKAVLMRKLGKKQLTLQLQAKLDAIPDALAAHRLTLAADGRELVYTYDTQGERTGITALLAGSEPRRHPLPRSGDAAELARGHLRRPGEAGVMNLHAVRAIYLFEMARTGRTLLQSIVSPVISTSLYFVVFGAAIGSRIPEIEGVSYGAFIVPGLIMLTLLTQSVVERLVRHLFPEVHRHHLRAAVGADLLCRDRARLRRRGGDQIDHPRPHHPGDGRLLRAAPDRPPRSGC